VLAEPRYILWNFVDLTNPNNNDSQARTWAEVEYRFWDMWQGNKPTPYLPGQFFYKSAGPIVAIGNNDGSQDPVIPTDSDQYMLGGYGSIRTKGKDLIGDERQIIFTTRSDAASNWVAGSGIPPVSGPQAARHEPMQYPLPEPNPPPQNGGTTAGQQAVWPWTRSRYSETERQGSPYSPALAEHSNDQLSYGNPNGIRDGLILVLTAGEDYRGL
jgi:hypothetical protein